jgi:hypothetical protein
LLDVNIWTADILVLLTKKGPLDTWSHLRGSPYTSLWLTNRKMPKGKERVRG